MEDIRSAVAIEKALGHDFRDRNLLATALTHPSFAGDPAGRPWADLPLGAQSAYGGPPGTQRLRAGAMPLGARAAQTINRSGNAALDPSGNRAQIAESPDCRTAGDLGAAHQRLEFLGDAVWGLLVGEYLFQREPRWTEGELSRARAHCAAAAFLASAAEAIGVPEALRLGPGEAAAGGRRKVRILAGAFEALLGAVFLDAGYEAAKAVGRRVLDRLYPAWQSPAPPYDPKSLLQIRAAAHGMIPRYALIGKSGSAHVPRFAVSVSVGEMVHAVGEGDSRRAAEREAARKALARMDASGISDPISRGRRG